MENSKVNHYFHFQWSVAQIKVAESYFAPHSADLFSNMLFNYTPWQPEVYYEVFEVSTTETSGCSVYTKAGVGN